MKNNFISSIWDFRQTTLNQTSYVTHNFFRWYGKLIPQLVSRLITMYSKEGDLVLANFAGSGTVLLESNILKRSSMGVDSNPLSILICKVKTLPYVPNTDKFLTRFGDFKKIKNSKIFPMDTEDEKWFDKQVFQDLMRIKNKIIEINDEKERNFYLLALDSIILKVSRVDSRCVNHIVLDKNKHILDVFPEFKNKVEEMNRSMKDYIQLSTKSKTTIDIGDARNLKNIDGNSIDLIISHPPYLGCINYSNIYKLNNKILGYNYDEVKENDLSTTSLQKYMINMEKVFDEMKRVLKTEKYACVVIGDNRKNGEIIPTFSYFINYAQKIGFKLKDIFIWIMSQKAGMNVKRRGNHIDHNYILIFQKSKL